jgi:hypothetical protein
LLEKQPNHFQQPAWIAGLMRPINPVYLFKAEERTELAQALGVDAIIMARVSYYANSKDYTGLGIGSSHLQPVLAFDMYASHGDSEIWFDRGFEGPKSEDSLGNVRGMENEELISKLSRPLAQETLKNFSKSE